LTIGEIADHHHNKIIEKVHVENRRFFIVAPTELKLKGNICFFKFNLRPGNDA
jgi:hypothetical protein